MAGVYQSSPHPFTSGAPPRKVVRGARGWGKFSCEASTPDAPRTGGKSEDEAMEEMRVRDLMSDHVISVHPGDSVDKVYDAMCERGIRHVAVIDDEGDLVGLVSHRDLLRLAQLVCSAANPVNRH